MYNLLKQTGHMENDGSSFDEIDLRSGSAETDKPPPPRRPQSTSTLSRFFRKTFSKKKRRLTAPVGDTELVKESISSPAECKQVGFNEEDFDFSRSSIQCCPFDISGYGSFLLMDEFKVRKPKKMKIMVFLFQKIVIFTKKQLNEEAFYYIGSVKMDQISVLPQGKNMKILQLKDHLASARFHKETVFSLEAASEYIQLQWRRTVEKCLWGQLIQARRHGGFSGT
ncbi:hypothetical protein D910_10448 [Dendroctonus ponderosae]|uniref:SOS1/NGEF-like PH domain-containing protein n=1 Tax=Dendroctonus ponderosae TaxID=77166 RepID=U4USK0_DENPD|nr:hypothetical protein D910_10448 [Dendroctonus ponderosae]